MSGLRPTPPIFPGGLTGFGYLTLRYSLTKMGGVGRYASVSNPSSLEAEDGKLETCRHGELMGTGEASERLIYGELV